MSQGFFCPHCQLINQENAEVCVHCGFKFKGFKPQSSTTVNVGHISHPEVAPLDRCTKVMPQLAKGDFALFIMDEEEPILLNNIDKVILGRDSEGLQGGTLDLDEYKPFELGVSRKHVQITWDNDGYWVEDLRSTNGTWLNRERIAAGVPEKIETRRQNLDWAIKNNGLL